MTVHVLLCQCLCYYRSGLACQRCKYGHVVSMSRVHTFEQVFVCCGIEVRETDWLFRRNERERERENERESQGQRVIRLFLSDLGNCQALGMKSDYMGV